MPDYINDLAPPVGMSAPQTSSPGAPAGGAPIPAPGGSGTGPVPGGSPPGGPGPITGIPEADAPPEIQEKVITLGAKAKSKIYEDPENFQNMMALLEKAGTKGFPEATSTIVNTVLDQIEKEEGRQSEEILAAAGAILIGAIAEDLTVGGAMEITPEMFNHAAAKSMQDWMTNHPDRVDQQAVMGHMAKAGSGAPPPGASPGPGMPGAPPEPGMSGAPPGAQPGPQQPTTTVPEPGGYLGGGQQ